MGQQSIHFLLPFFYDLLHPFPDPSVQLLIWKPGPAPGKTHGLIRAVGASNDQGFRAIQVIDLPVSGEKYGQKSGLHVHPATVPVFQTISFPIYPAASSIHLHHPGGPHFVITVDAEKGHGKLQQHLLLAKVTESIGHSERPKKLKGRLLWKKRTTALAVIRFFHRREPIYKGFI